MKICALVLCLGLLACKQPAPPPVASAPNPNDSPTSPTAPTSPTVGHGDAAGQLSAQVAAAPSGTGKLAGVVKLAGPAPQLPPQEHLNDKGICGASGPDQSLVVGAEGAVSNAVVTVDVPNATPPAPIHGALMDQKGCSYVPRVIVLPVGSELGLKNSDAALHTVHGYLGDETAWNVVEPLEGQTKTVKLDKPGVVKVRCDVHPWMLGWVLAVQTPFYAVTDAHGRFSIDGLPPGTYTAHVWHERLAPTSLPVKIEKGATAEQVITLQAK